MHIMTWREERQQLLQRIKYMSVHRARWRCWPRAQATPWEECAVRYMDVSHTNNRTDETERSNTGQGRSQRVGWCWGSGIIPNAEMELTSAKIRHWGTGTGTGLDKDEGFSPDLLRALGERWTNNRKQKHHTHSRLLHWESSLCLFWWNQKLSRGQGDGSGDRTFVRQALGPDRVQILRTHINGCGTRPVILWFKRWRKEMPQENAAYLD